MQLRPGLKLNSAVSEAQVVVVRAPAGDVDLRCGGEPMTAAGASGPPRETAGGEPLLIGKRYADDTGTLELLCTKAGAGGLSVGDRPLAVKAAKALPASD
ncbi:hypothetical protein [Spirillospora sp. NPDC029432]|uniref:hypothetical protein n=1 Tax=Spirillospora sp. NPDC029432 TaxID=3154599 RepID=UPI0034534E2A